MRYTLIDLSGYSYVDIFDHKVTHEHLTKWTKTGCNYGGRRIRPIVHNDGVRQYKFSNALYSFFIPETHPLYNCNLIFDPSVTMIKFEDALIRLIFNQLKERRA